MWLGLAERQPGTGRAWLGQRNHWTRSDWRSAIEKQDTGAMLAAMHEVPVGPGDAWIVRTGLPHCLGGQALFLEVQEPTDFAVRCEYRRDGAELPESQRWMGLDLDRALECLQAEPIEVESCRLTPLPIDSGRHWKRESLCGPGDCECFEADIITIDGTAAFPATPPEILIVLEGAARIGEMKSRAFDRFAVLPEEDEFRVSGECRLLACRAGSGADSPR